TIFSREWSSDVCSSDLLLLRADLGARAELPAVEQHAVEAGLRLERLERAHDAVLAHDVGRPALAPGLLQEQDLLGLGVRGTVERSEERRRGNERGAREA